MSATKKGTDNGSEKSSESPWGIIPNNTPRRDNTLSQERLIPPFDNKEKSSIAPRGGFGMQPDSGERGTEKLQIHCLHHTSVISIKPPLCIVDIDNGCEAFSPTLYILAKSELTTTMQSLTRSQFFLQYNLQYVKMSSFVVF